MVYLDEQVYFVVYEGDVPDITVFVLSDESAADLINVILFFEICHLNVIFLPVNHTCMCNRC